MRPIDADALMKWANDQDLTPDGGIDINDLEQYIENTVGKIGEINIDVQRLAEIASKHNVKIDFEVKEDGGCEVWIEPLERSDDIPIYYKGVIEKIIETIDDYIKRKIEPQTENPCDGCVCDDGKHLMYCMNCKGIAWKTEPPKVEDEPQTERPCDNCQEFDCYGCEYKEERASDERI